MLRRWHMLKRADVLDNSFTPAVDVRPCAIADTILVACYVDHITAPARARHAIMRLFIRDNDDPVVFLLDFFKRSTEIGSVMRLASIESVAQREPPAWRHFDQIIRKSEHASLLTDFAKQDGESARSVGAKQFGPTRQRGRHAARYVHEEHRPPRQFFLFNERRKHRALECFFPLGRMASRSEKTERQDASGVHRTDTGKDQRLVHTCLLHVPQIP